MRVAYRNFTGGEVSESLSGRYDLDKYATSMRCCENFLPELHGPLERRSGTYFIAELDGPAVLLPFEFSSDPDQTAVLVMQDGLIRVARADGFVLDGDGKRVELVAPYEQAQLYDISSAQSGDMAYLAHQAHQLRKVVRLPDRWELREVSMLPAIGAPASVSVGFSGSSGGYPIKYKVVAVDEDGVMGAPVLGQQPRGKHPSDWVVGDYAMVSWPAVEGAVEYNVYRESAGSYGFIGMVEAEEGVRPSFRDDNYSPDTSDTPREPEDPFVEGNYPGIVCFHQQRLVLAAPALEPQRWYASRTGSYEDFSKSRPAQDDDALEFTIASGRVDTIQWMASFGDLLIGTSGCEYKAIGADQGVITPSSLNIREQSFWGSIKLKPLIIGNSILHVQRQGSRVRDLLYSLEKDGYAGNDLSVLASHLFENRTIRQWAYRQAPGSSVYAVRDDGVMLVLSYMQEHGIYGWARVTTQGRFVSVACVPGHLQDVVYVVVAREVHGETRYYLERFMPQWDYREGDVTSAFFVDSGLSYNNPDQPVSVLSGLEHLEGHAVEVLADGAPLTPRVVKDGTITLDSPAGVVHAGLGYRSLMCPQTPEADTDTGSTLGRRRAYNRCRIGVLGSVTGRYGDDPSDPSAMYDLPAIPDFYDTAMSPVTGFMDVDPVGSFDESGRIWFSQDKPLPFVIASLEVDVEIRG